MGRDDYVRPDGVREVWWKCMCGLEEKRYFDTDGVPLAVRYRYQGLWADAKEWLMLTVPMQFCPMCEDGEGCDHCGHLGVVDADGSPVETPKKSLVGRRVP